MKRRTWMMIWVVALLPLTAAQADHRIDWDDWYEGRVEVGIDVQRGEGAVFAPGEPVRLEFRANETAYHLVYGIDTEGFVRLLFPRYWEDDGWVPEGRTVKLHAEDLAWPAHRWGSDGIVYVEVVSSPLPFDFHGAGLVREASATAWYDGPRAMRVHGDPFIGFNTVHERLFPDWDNAVFAVDYTYFYVGAYYEAPNYLGYRYRRVYVRPPHSGFYVGVRFGWSWEFGYGYCRPVYARYYVPGVHYVHHHVQHHHHVAYRHHHGRYARHGHYGYRDGWHGSRYRVVHDTQHRKRITHAPERKRTQRAVRERDAHDPRAVHVRTAERRERVRVPDVRQRERKQPAVVDRGQRQRAEERARQQLEERRRTPRVVGEARREERRSEATRESKRRDAKHEAKRRDVKPRIERGKKAVPRRGATVETRQGKREAERSKRSEARQPSQKRHAARKDTDSASPQRSKAQRAQKPREKAARGAQRSKERSTHADEKSTRGASAKSRARR